MLFTLLFVCAFAGAGFGQVDVPRRTTAITYPLDEVVLVQFRGTTRFPRMKGEAKMKRTSRNGTEIELSVSKMPRPFQLGAGYATYVLWAISPEGQADEQPQPAAAPAAPAAAPAVAKNPASEAKKIFKANCVVCHGDHGAGDGPGAAALEPKPRAFSDAAWQDSVTDEHLAKVIRDGGAAVGKSPIMPGNPQLKGKDDVLAELVKIVRDFKK